MVFAARVVEAIEQRREGPLPTGAMRSVLAAPTEIPSRPLPLPPMAAAAAAAAADDAGKLRDRLQRAMTSGAGVLRNSLSLVATAATVQEVAGGATDPELQNLALTAWALVHAALAREESRGAHSRTDFPDASSEFEVRLVFT